jgi:hypothetical protein
MRAAWQEPAALLVVAATAALLLRHALRRRKTSGACGAGCACDTAHAGTAPPGPDGTLNLPPETRILE